MKPYFDFSAHDPLPLHPLHVGQAQVPKQRRRRRNRGAKLGSKVIDRCCERAHVRERNKGSNNEIIGHILSFEKNKECECVRDRERRDRSSGERTPSECD